MNQYQIDLFNSLEALVASGDAFYRQEFNLDGKTYWIYNYRLASYTEFLKPGALECRGHMYEVDGNGDAIRMASMPPRKFFNLNENPSTMGLDLDAVDTVELKADGSLMSTFTHKGEMRMKSKGSLFSEQAIDATRWIYQDENREFRSAIQSLEGEGWTVNLEWCAPFNRIVIGYEKAHLKVLNVRHRETGVYMTRDLIESYFKPDMVIDRPDLGGMAVADFVKAIPGRLDDIEGFVCRIGDLWFKVKTEKYMSLHHAKDSINNPRRLFEAIVDEGIDDLRSLFATDALAIQQIDEMQEKVNKLYNGMVKEVETFYHAHKDGDKKSYAIAGRDKDKLTQLYFGLAMNMYIGREVDYKGFLKSKYKELGFRDTSLDKQKEE